MKKIIIIGGGVPGLSAGIYAQKNGFESVIYEKYTALGGHCTHWTRKDYHMNGNISFLTGVKPGEELHDVWQELGAFTKDDIYYQDTFVTIEMNGKKLEWYLDLDKLETHLLELAPEDTNRIMTLLEDIRAAQHIKMPIKKAMETMNFLDWMGQIKSMKPAMKVANKYRNITTEELANQFENPLLQQAILSCVPKGFQALTFLSTMANLSSRYSGKIYGGAETLVANLTKQYESLGGTYHCRHTVKQILIENGKATGALFRNGEIVSADYVIAACDPNVIFNKFLPREYLNKDYQEVIEDKANLETHSMTQIFFGIDADLSHYPSYYAKEIEEYVDADGNMVTMAAFEHFSEDHLTTPNRAKTVLKASTTTKNYNEWKSLDKQTYRERKQAISETYVKNLEKLYPEAKGKIEVIDVSTPLTIERYCGSYEGSYMGMEMSPALKKQYIKSTIKGLNNVFIASQWMSLVGGLPTAAVSGKFSIQKICKLEKQKFNGVN